MSLPHARGGVSHCPFSCFQQGLSSPRTWGCFRFGIMLADAEVGLPHARGGVSSVARFSPYPWWSSPRTWGCFLNGCLSGVPLPVFPTHVGVFQSRWLYTAYSAGLPHARGGVSKTPFHDVHSLRSSPRTWGCFPAYRRYLCWLMVFPTHVGVFLSIYAFASHMLSLPHARGGVSFLGLKPPFLIASSPRTWGCFKKRGRD